MRLADEAKRKRIIETAARLFATTPFHEVTLSSIARASKIGKGTVYVYFKSKDDVYLAVIYEGFARLVARLKSTLGDNKASPLLRLKRVIDAVVRFAHAHPHFYELTRRSGVPTADPAVEKPREEMFALIEAIIRQGNKAGLFADKHPALTARFIPGLIRMALLHPVRRLSAPALARHITQTVLHGISKA
jgi:AcrR family transcriptional regulator